MRRPAGLALSALLFCGCALGPDYERPELDVPKSYFQPIDQGESFANLAWWEVFEDPDLEALIRIALEENQDLRCHTLGPLRTHISLPPSQLVFSVG